MECYNILTTFSKIIKCKSQKTVVYLFILIDIEKYVPS